MVVVVVVVVVVGRCFDGDTGRLPAGFDLRAGGRVVFLAGGASVVGRGWNLLFPPLGF